MILQAHSEAKADARGERKELAALARDQRRRERHCFFTRPIGHEYRLMIGPEDPPRPAYVCVGCGKPRP